MILFIACIWAAFRYVGRLVAMGEYNYDEDDRKFAWVLGAALFAHAASCISVSYFDQSFVFLYLTMAAIASLYANRPNESVEFTSDERALGEDDAQGTSVIA